MNYLSYFVNIYLAQLGYFSYQQDLNSLQFIHEEIFDFTRLYLQLKSIIYKYFVCNTRERQCNNKLYLYIYIIHTTDNDLFE